MLKETVLLKSKLLILSAAISISALYGADFNGYLQLGYQHDDKGNTDIALGSKLGYLSSDFSGLKFAFTIYASTALNSHDGAGIPFFNSNNNSYAILNEAYIKGSWSNTEIKAGRQILDTPFADSDDLGMVPNSFEAVKIENKTIPNTTLTALFLNKMSGVDAKIPEKFNKINGNRGVWVLGAAYSGIENLELSGWYYRINKADIDKIYYLEANYKNKIADFDYTLAAQYALQHYKNAASAKVFGISTSLGYNGINIFASYNKSNDNKASNGFGGGPFFTSAEHLTIAEGGKNAKAYMFGAEFDASAIGLEGLIFSVGKLTLKSENGIKSTELDISANYSFNDNLELSAVYSKVKERINEDKFDNTRVFLTYKF